MYLRCFVFLTVFFSAMITYSKDHSVRCFFNEDKENYLEKSQPFGVRSSVTLRFSYMEYSYIITVTRKSEFGKHIYEVLKMDGERGGYQSYFLIAKKYDDLVNIDEYIFCLAGPFSQ